MINNRLELLEREIEDKYVQENFRILRRYLNQFSIGSAGDVNLNAAREGSYLRYNGTDFVAVDLFVKSIVPAEESIGFTAHEDSKIEALSLSCSSFGTSISIEILKNSNIEATLDFTSRGQIIKLDTLIELSPGDLVDYNIASSVGTTSNVRLGFYLQSQL